MAAADTGSGPGPAAAAAAAAVAAQLVRDGEVANAAAEVSDLF